MALWRKTNLVMHCEKLSDGKLTKTRYVILYGETSPMSASKVATRSQGNAVKPLQNFIFIMREPGWTERRNAYGTKVQVVYPLNAKFRLFLKTLWHDYSPCKSGCWKIFFLYIVTMYSFYGVDKVCLRNLTLEILSWRDIEFQKKWPHISLPYENGGGGTHSIFEGVIYSSSSTGGSGCLGGI